MFSTSLLFLLYFCSLKLSPVQENVAGPPCISFFSTDLIGTQHRIFDVECDGDGLIYLAYPSIDTVMVYDGEFWQKIDVEAPLALATDTRGTVWVAQGVGIGHFEKNELNQIKYKSFDPGFSPDDLFHFGFAFQQEDGVRIGNGRVVVEIDSNSEELKTDLIRAGEGETFVGFDGSSIISRIRESNVPNRIVQDKRLPMLSNHPNYSIEAAAELNDGTLVFTTNGFKYLRVLKEGKLEFFEGRRSDDLQLTNIKWVLPMPENRLGAVAGGKFCCYSNTGKVLYQVAGHGTTIGEAKRFGLFRDGRIWIITSNGFVVSAKQNGANCWSILEGARPATYDIKLSKESVFVASEQGLFRIPKAELRTPGTDSKFKLFPYGCGTVETIDDKIVCATMKGLLVLDENDEISKIADGLFFDMFCHRTEEQTFILARDQYASLFIFEFAEGQAEKINHLRLPADGMLFHSFGDSAFLIKQRNGESHVVEFPSGLDKKPVFHKMPSRLTPDKIFKFRDGIFLIENQGVVEVSFSNGNVSFDSSPYFQSLANTATISNATHIVDCGSDGVAIVDEEGNVEVHAWDGEEIAAHSELSFYFGHPFAVRLMQRDQENGCFWTMVGRDLFCLNERQFESNSDYGINIRTTTKGQLDSRESDDLIQLSPNSGATFEFALPHRFYFSEAKPQYQYWLEGNDSDWSEWSGLAKKEYTNLNGGNYRFHVRARDPSGQIVENSIGQISVASPWYFRTGSIVAYGLLLVGLIFLASRIRTAKLMADNQRMEKLVHDRTIEIQKKTKEILETTAQLHATERKSEAKRLASFDTLVAGIAHDFNNLLTVVSANNEMIVQRGDEQVREYAVNSLRAVVSAVELCQEMSQFSDTTPIALAPKDIAMLVRGWSELASGTIPASVNFQLANMDKGCFALTDPSQLRRALLNLVVNAGEAARTSVQVDVSVQEFSAGQIENARYVGDGPEPGNYVVIGISDDGCGLEQEVIAKIFDPFFSTKKLGRGLGLAIVVKIVGRHNGFVMVQSSDGNTCFQICLPTTSLRPRIEQSTNQESRVEPKSILVVDDDEHVLFCC